VKRNREKNDELEAFFTSFVFFCPSFDNRHRATATTTSPSKTSTSPTSVLRLTPHEKCRLLSFFFPALSSHQQKQARQAAVQAAQKAIGFSYLLGKSDRAVAVALPTALVAFSFVAIAKGAAQMYTQPGKNA
jgi:hypothetical protein